MLFKQIWLLKYMQETDVQNREVPFLWSGSSVFEPY